MSILETVRFFGKRKKNENEIYHVLLHGISQQQIFEDSEDRKRFCL
jgi:hypothetical protein